MASLTLAFIDADVDEEEADDKLRADSCDDIIFSKREKFIV